MPRKTSSKTKVIYFDIETYSDRDSGLHQQDSGDVPVVIPYAIGCCTHEPNSYRVFTGRYCAQEFVRWLAEECRGYSQTILWGFNIDYDFQVIKPWILAEYPVDIKYALTDRKTFIGGHIKCKSPRMNIKLKDLWIWDKQMGLGSYYKTFIERAETDEEWASLMEEYGVTGMTKGTIDYDKWDVDWDKQVYYHQDDPEHENPYPIEWDKELEYLKKDVIGLPLVYLYIDDFKKLVCETLGWENGIFDKKIKDASSIPSFAKLVASHYLNYSIEDNIRQSVSKEEYDDLEDSYFGGFVGGNRFKTVVEDCVDIKGLPMIFSYDVNSMYPWAMTTGIPEGPFLDIPPKGPYATWYEVRFDEWFIEPESGSPEGIIYRPKEKYDLFNNDLFGKSFYLHQLPGESSARVFILKEMWDVYERMCEGSLKVVGVRFQKKNMKIKTFVDKLYEIKCDKENYSRVQISAIKLVLNSLYGKFAERAHTDCWEWHSAQDNYVKVDKTISPKFKWPNISAGLYICSLSRAKLFTGILDEIDNGNIPLYSDTDSLKLIVNNPVTLDVDNKRLGAWKNEGCFTHFFFNLKCKKYYLYNIFTNVKHYACAGLSKSRIKNFSWRQAKLLYSPNNDFLFKNAKRTTKRNHLWQTYFKRIDVRFNYVKGKPITHVVDEDGNITSCQ